MRHPAETLCRARIGLLSAALWALVACAGARSSGPAESLRGHGAVVEVRNDDFNDVVIYLIRGGTPVTLGVVPGFSRRAFPIHEGLVGGGSSVSLGSGLRGEPIRRVTTPFELGPGRIASWLVRAGAPVEPVVR